MDVFHWITRRRIISTFLLLIVIDIFLYAALLCFAIIDEKPGLAQTFFYGLLKYVFGFPLVLAGRGLPFFPDGISPGYSIFL